MRIWKYHLEVTDRQTINMPQGARILTVQVQGSACCLWAEVDELTVYKEPRIIAIYGTGNPLPDEPGDYIATFQLADGRLVFHAYELK